MRLRKGNLLRMIVLVDAQPLIRTTQYLQSQVATNPMAASTLQQIAQQVLARRIDESCLQHRTHNVAR